MVGLGGLAGADVNGLQGAGHRGDRLHGGTDAQDVADAHAAFDAAGTVGGADDLAVRVLDDLIVGGGAAPRGRAETVADLNALDGLDAHQGGRQAGVEPAVPVDVAAQSRRQAVGKHFHHSAEGFAFLVGGIDLGHHGV